VNRACVTQETELSNTLNAEQARWTEFNGRLDEIERRYRPQARANHICRILRHQKARPMRGRAFGLRLMSVVQREIEPHEPGPRIVFGLSHVPPFGRCRNTASRRRMA